MICAHCDSENYEVTMNESFPCSHCDGYVFVEYCICKDCGTLWRAINGEVDAANIITPDDFINMLNPPPAMDLKDLDMSDKVFMNRIEEELAKYDRRDNAQSMSDLIHRCVKCSAVAHETKPGYFECDDCGFSWEVIDFDE